MSRLRDIVAPATFGGKPCGTTNQTVPCNTVACPIDCIVSAWAAWAPCSLKCGNGTTIRSRAVTNQPAYGGSPCPELTNEDSCNEDPCPVDCAMSDWSSWSQCTQACGTGATSRTRTISAQPLNGGLPCGDIEEDDPCNTQQCPEDRAAILVDRIRKLELQDRVNTLEELQIQQAAQLAATQTQELLGEVGGGTAVAGSSTGVANNFLEEGSSFLEQLAVLWSDREIPYVAELRAKAKTQDNKKDVDEDVVTDEVDAQGHHHKRHHHHRKHHEDSKFAQTAPPPNRRGDPQMERVTPLFAHTVKIPPGNNNDFLEERW